MRFIGTTEMEPAAPQGTKLAVHWDFTVKKKKLPIELFPQIFLSENYSKSINQYSSLSPASSLSLKDPWFLQFQRTLGAVQPTAIKFFVVVFSNSVLTPLFRRSERTLLLDHVWVAKRKSSYRLRLPIVLNAHSTKMSVLMAKFRIGLCQLI